MQVTASKLTTAPNDVNKTESQANQDAVTVTSDESTITVKGNLETLNTFASTNPNQGSGKWIGIDINTGLDSILDVTWGGQPLTQDDVDEAASVGLGAGHIIFWVKAEALPRTITLGHTGEEAKSIQVVFVSE